MICPCFRVSSWVWASPGATGWKAGSTLLRSQGSENSWPALGLWGGCGPVSLTGEEGWGSSGLSSRRRVEVPGTSWKYSENHRTQGWPGSRGFPSLCWSLHRPEKQSLRRRGGCLGLAVHGLKFGIIVSRTHLWPVAGLGGGEDHGIIHTRVEPGLVQREAQSTSFKEGSSLAGCANASLASPWS